MRIWDIDKLAKRGGLIPLVREMPADLDTPISAYLKLSEKPPSFMLESVEGGERLGRYSFIGFEPEEVIKGRGNPIPILREKMRRAVKIEGLPRFSGGFVGYISYEVASYFEDIPVPEKDPLSLPEYYFLLIKDMVVFDHVTHKLLLITHIDPEKGVEDEYRRACERFDEMEEKLLFARFYAKPLKGGGEADISSNMERREFEDKVRKVKEYIFDGEAIQVVLSQRFEAPVKASSIDIYRALRVINPSPYMYYLDLGDFQIIGSSPEMLVRVEGGFVETHPIAGTRPRGRDEEEDKRLEEELLSDEKERAEHTMLVDLGRNDIGRVSEIGSVVATQLMEVEKYSHVMHLVSHIKGKLKAGLDMFDALISCFPAGTVSGAPKIRAMEIIGELEPERRGPYAGALGYIDFKGNLDMAIVIRTIIRKGRRAYFQAGAGIVADSIPEREYEECVNKAKALLKAIELSEGR